MQLAGPDIPGRGVRASDAERERCAHVLRDAYAEGRLSLAELEERLTRARDARTRVELRVLTRDVPRDHVRRAGRALERLDRAALTVHATVFTGVGGGLSGLWALTGQGDFWPAWIIAPAAVLLGSHAGSSWAVRRAVRRRRQSCSRS
ncbi:MAG: DUF1707 domain-containing protein [Actinomycetota bacterium]|nr:DUF1707 domain-containing protein [Actinomycetota bacterium]